MRLHIRWRLTAHVFDSLLPEVKLQRFKVRKRELRNEASKDKAQWILQNYRPPYCRPNLGNLEKEAKAPGLNNARQMSRRSCIPHADV